MKAYINQLGQMTFLHFFNSKEIYSMKGFDTERKARNYAKKFGYQIFEKLPNDISQFENVN